MACSLLIRGKGVATSNPATLTVNPAWYVTHNGSGNGTSWSNAFGSIQAAVNAASAVGKGEIWVAAGTYTATTDMVVTLRSNVAIYGGFAGTETTRDARNWKVNVTIIDGQSERRYRQLLPVQGAFCRHLAGWSDREDPSGPE